MSTTRRDLAQWILKEARRAGAQDAALALYSDRSVDVELREGQIDKLQESLSQSLNLELFVKGRYSSHTTCNLSKPALERFIREAVALTRHLAADPHRRLPEPELCRIEAGRELQVFDPRQGSLSSERRIALAREIEAAARAEKAPLISATASVSDGMAERLVANTAGFLGESRSTRISLAASATVKDGEKGRPEDYAYSTRRFLADLPSADTVGREAVRRASAKVGQSKLPSGRYDLVVENRVAGRILGPLLQAMSAYALEQKQSFLEGKLGQAVASPLLNLVSDPFVPKGLQSRLFDGDGIALHRRPLFEGGVLKGLFVDNYYGRKLGMTPTGGNGNLVFQPGTKDRNTLVAGLAKGILVTGFIGGNANGTTGDFSYGLTGMLVEQGRIVRPINEVNLTGNLLTLWKALAEVGSDVETSSSLLLPSLRFNDQSISGS